MPDTEPDRAKGGVPHAFRLQMAWRWVPDMPLRLRRNKPFLYALATVASMADTAGRTRWHNRQDENEPGRALRLTQLARAMGSDDKDARRYLAAAVAAGVLATEEAPRRGRTTVYVLQLPPVPRWAAALAVLDVGEPATDVDDAHENGGLSPELGEAHSASRTGDSPPNSGPARARRERGTVPPWSSGDSAPMSSGDSPPNIPGVSKNTPHEMVAVGPQVRDARGGHTHDRADDPSPPPGPAPLRSVPPPRAATRLGGRPPAAGGERQLPLMMPVPAAARPVERPAHAPADAETPHPLRDRQRPAQQSGPPRAPWRVLVARERPADAARVYRDRWTGEAATYLPDPTGT